MFKAGPISIDVARESSWSVAGTSMPPFGNADDLKRLHNVASHIVERVLTPR